MGGSFAFLVPVMFAIIGGTFLLTWRMRIPAALPWGLGYGAAALAFAIPDLFTGTSVTVTALLADTLFIVANLCFCRALLRHFRRPPVPWAERVIVVAGIAASLATTLGLDALRLELVANDVACATLVALALVRVRGRGRRPADAALMAVAALCIADDLLRIGVALSARAVGLDAFAGSAYAFMMQASGAVLGLLLGLAVLVALMLDRMAGYEKEAMTDPLTGLWNRRGFEAAAPDLARSTLPEGSVLTCDIDHFKRVNDTFGHAVGDRVIMTVADLLKAGLPPGAVVSRFGGEEFIVYLPTADGEARLLADALRRSIADHAGRTAGIDWPLTASFGLAMIDPHDATLHDAIARADRKLYEAKRAGRNAVAARPLAA